VKLSSVILILLSIAAVAVATARDVKGASSLEASDMNSSGSYQLNVSPKSVTIGISGSAVFKVSVTGPAGDNTLMTLTLSGLPDSMTCSEFCPPDQIRVGTNAEIVLWANDGTPTGTFNIVINVKSDTLNLSKTVTVVVGELTAIRNEITLNNFEVQCHLLPPGCDNGGFCPLGLPVLVQCFSIQQNFFVQNGTSSYWAQNILEIGKTIDGTPVAFGTFQILRNGKLVACNGIVSPIGNQGCVEFLLYQIYKYGTAIKLTSTIYSDRNVLELSSFFCDDNPCITTNYDYPTSPGSYITCLTLCANPELAIVGDGNSAQVTFDQMDGSVQTFVDLSDGKGFVNTLSLLPLPNSATETSESALNDKWTPSTTKLNLIGGYVTNTISVAYSQGAEDAGFGFVPYSSSNPPLAVSSSSCTVCEGNTKGGANVILDGSASYDPDGGSLTYQWVGGFGSATGAKPTVFLGLGDHIVTLTVNNGVMDSDPVSLDIEVVDTTPPMIAAHRTPLPNVYDWTNRMVTVSFDCFDTVWDVSPPQSVVLGNDGRGQTATGTCTDGSGNSNSTTLGDINIDKTSPYAVSCSVRPLPNQNGWYNTTVTVQCTFQDDLSGVPDDTLCIQVDGITCPGPVVRTTIGTEGRDQSVTLCTYDRAGNKGCTTVGGISIDKTAPVISSPQDGQVFILRQALLANATCTDSLSGIDTCLLPAGFIDTGTVGAHSYLVTASDFAGNSRTLTVQYNVHYVFVTVSPKPANNRFQVGGTIPVRFQLKDALGNFVSSATARIWVDSPSNPGKCSGSSNTGNYFRYDSTDNFYMFNLSTKGMTAGQHTIYLTLDDGTTQSTIVNLSSI